MIRSSIAAASGRPAPRNAPIGVVFVERDRALVGDLRDAVHALRHHARRPHRERAAEAGVRAGVADDLARACPTIVPSRLQPELARTAPARGRAASRSGSRSGSRPTSPAAASRSAAATATQCSAASPGLPPNAPPTCGATTRNFVGSRSNTGATRLREAVRHLRRDVDGEVVPGAVRARALSSTGFRVVLLRRRARPASESPASASATLNWSPTWRASARQSRKPRRADLAAAAREVQPRVVDQRLDEAAVVAELAAQLDAPR